MLNHSAISLSLKTTQQSPFLAPLFRGPKTVWECARACVFVDGMNLKYALPWHIHISVHSVLCQCYTQAYAPSNHLRIANRRGLKWILPTTQQHAAFPASNNSVSNSSLKYAKLHSNVTTPFLFLISLSSSIKTPMCHLKLDTECYYQTML